MNITLKSLSIENFKGIKVFEINFDQRTIIKAANGVGKTSVFDAFLWLLFDKDSTGRKDFDLRPLDKDNNPIKGLIVAVQADIDVDGTVHTFRKEQHENLVKGQLRGYEARLFIDEVPKKVSEYAEYIGGIIPEDTFKLTDLRHFNEKLHWKEQRAVLKEIAGDIGTPDGFDELLGNLKGRTIEEYKKVLAGQKNKLKTEQAEINPKLDELNKFIPEFNEVDTSELEKKRDTLQGKIAKVDELRKSVLESEQERQRKLSALNKLEAEKLKREIELKNDTSGVKSLLDEKQAIEINIADIRRGMVETRNTISNLSTTIQSKQTMLESLIVSKNQILAEMEQAEAKDPTADIKTESDICFNCGQTLPDSMKAENEKKRLKAIAKAEAEHKQVLENINRRGEEKFEQIKLFKAEIEKLGSELKTAQQLLANQQAKFDASEKAKAKRFAEIDKAIKENKTTPPEQDEKWRNIVAEITKAENEIGEPVSEELNSLENRKNLLNTELAETNKALAQVDTIKTAKNRIAELTARKKELGQLIADVEKQLNDIQEYSKAVCELLDTAINGKFKYVKFKLFDYLLNGDTEECCETTLNGVPYSDLSYGQKIFVGIDIINVLSAHFEISVPLFIDNAEGLTLPVEFNGQVIQLFAQAGISKLTVETLETKTIKRTSNKKELANV